MSADGSSWPIVPGGRKYVSQCGAKPPILVDKVARQLCYRSSDPANCSSRERLQGAPEHQAHPHNSQRAHQERLLQSPESRRLENLAPALALKQWEADLAHQQTQDTDDDGHTWVHTVALYAPDRDITPNLQCDLRANYLTRIERMCLSAAAY